MLNILLKRSLLRVSGKSALYICFYALVPISIHACESVCVYVCACFIFCVFVCFRVDRIMKKYRLKQSNVISSVPPLGLHLHFCNLICEYFVNGLKSLL